MAADWSKNKARRRSGTTTSTTRQGDDEDSEGELERAALFAVEGDGAVLIEPMSCAGSDTAGQPEFDDMEEVIREVRY
ncbi:hypothetical protein AB0M50_38855 [Nonomuraea fuscirosea]|uniref:hypothetical protein n=1 Tax=Nonomuraea fuscirosea TaxID=1291556 RepID=UPI003418E26C